MPAVSMCDAVSVALRCSLDVPNSQINSNDLSMSLAGGASRILSTEIDYEETENYQSTVLNPLKTKYKVLSLPKVDIGNGSKTKEISACTKKVENRNTEPRLPEPATTLYPANEVNLGWKNLSVPIGAGMFNVGNTCYLNSTLQALFHVPALVNWLLSDPHHNAKCEQNDAGGECLTCAVAKTLQFTHQKSGQAIKPFYVYNKLKLICRTMVPGQQEDAHEFLRYLLEGMERAYLVRHRATKLDSYSKETTPINQIFGGYIRTEVKCLQCRHISTTFQHFQDLLLDIRKAGTLDEALSGYFSQEQLDSNDYKCEACKRRVPATKQFSLERPPKVLCVQLKRFSVLGGKIARHIGFKQTVDMGPYLRREPGEVPKRLMYKLTSIITHMGSSANCGHYTAVAQVATGKFYSFDDFSVRQISQAHVMNTNAYIMIFEMESPSVQLQQQYQPSVRLNGNIKGQMFLNGLTKKSMESSGHSNNSSNGSSLKNKDCASDKSALLVSSHPTSSTSLSSQNRKSQHFIGPQLPPSYQNSSTGSKGGKIVDYDDGASSDDDTISSDRKGLTETSSNSRDSSKVSKLSNGSNASTYAQAPGTKQYISQNNSQTIKVKSQNKSSNIDMNSGSSNGSNHVNSGNTSVCLKRSNGRPNMNGNMESNGKDKWYNSNRMPGKNGGSDDKISTKLSSNNQYKSQSYQNCKRPNTNSSSSISSTVQWSVTDHEKNESSSEKYYNSTPNAAAMRDFSGTNRSDPTRNLQKTSHLGYSNDNVRTWDDNRSHINRDADNERRHERKRHYDAYEDSLDRGRTKKIKSRNHDRGPSNPGYNPLQEHQNSKNFGSSRGFHQRYQNQHHGRSRKPNNYRHHNQYMPSKRQRR